MAIGERMGRREFLKLSSAGLAVAGAADLLACAAVRPPGASQGISYFGRFGITEALLAEALAAALSRGADSADVFVQHRVSSSLTLEDGAVNRAFVNVELGIGVRAIRGDQQGYGFTEDLDPRAVRECALTAATIAEGPARAGPQRFRVGGALPSRYPVKLSWEDVRPGQRFRCWPTSTPGPSPPTHASGRPPSPSATSTAPCSSPTRRAGSWRTCSP